MPEIALEPFNELRFEVGPEKEFKVFVIEGNCEILGQELLNERWYTFKNARSFLYTLKGCKLRIEGAPELQYVSDESNIQDAVSLFLKLNSHPRNVMVLGKARSTLALTLINFFARVRKKVIFTELDPSSGNLVFPGVIGSTLIDKIVDFNKGFDVLNTLAYFYGTTKIKDKDHYIKVLEELSKKGQDHVNIVIGPNNMTFIEKIHGMFKIESIVVVGDERMMHMIPIDVDKTRIRPSSGLVDDDATKKIHSYFYGRSSELTPFSLNLKGQKIFSKENEMLAPETALPLGASRKLQSSPVKEVEFSENSIMAIVDCQDEQRVLTSPCTGFLLALEKETQRVLSPQSKLPKDQFLFRGDIRYFES